MKVLYIWNGDYGNSNFHNLGFNINSKYTIEYCRDKNMISVQKNEDYIRGFWGENITDCFAVVGENGSGKTVLMNLLMEICRDLKEEIIPAYKYIIAFENEDSEDIHIYYTLDQGKIEVDESVDPHIKSRITISEISSNKVDVAERLKTAYFHNMLNRADYRTSDKCSFDYSIGRMLCFYSAMASEMHAADITSDKIVNYFKNEDFNVIEFLYNYANNNTLNIRFPMPDKIYISIADESFNTEYLIGKAQQRWKDNQDDFAGQVKNFFETLNKIFDTANSSWIDSTVKQLIMNCFKIIVFPGYVPKDIHLEDYMRYVNSFNELLRNLCELNLQNMDQKEKCAVIAAKLPEFKNNFNSAVDIIENARAFLNWIIENTDEIMRFENKNERRLDIKINNDTQSFMENLIDHYSKNSFAFPFYNFSFNLSTGENLLLTLFANLYHMKKYQEKVWHNPYTYPVSINKGDNILLVFDEAELSMHPRWQREYMNWILDFCSSFFEEEKVQIIVTTHSPILLSDFPSKNVLYLEKDRSGRTKVKYDHMKTFGNNIHTIYLNSFFLDDKGVVGAFSEKKINEIADQLFDYRKNCRQSNLPQIEKEIELIGEGIVKDRLLELYHQCVGRHINNDQTQQAVMNETLNKMVDQLKKQKEQLEMMICTLENEAGIKE